jgi:hypothetical protein
MFSTNTVSLPRSHMIFDCVRSSNFVSHDAPASRFRRRCLPLYACTFTPTMASDMHLLSMLAYMTGCHLRWLLQIVVAALHPLVASICHSTSTPLTASACSGGPHSTLNPFRGFLRLLNFDYPHGLHMPLSVDYSLGFYMPIYVDSSSGLYMWQWLLYVDSSGVFHRRW